jgi:hypothetical protein
LLLLTFQINAQSQVNSLHLHWPFFAGLDEQGIEIKDRVYRRKWPILPSLDFFVDRIGYIGDEAGRDFHPIQFFKLGLDLPR